MSRLRISLLVLGAALVSLTALATTAERRLASRSTP